MTTRRTFVAAAAAGAGTLAAPAFVRAQGNYPNRPIRLICPWTAGGTTDIVMRSWAESASKILGQQVVIENKAGAGGTLGAVELANSAKPDGYTLAQLPQSVFRIPHMQKVQFDTTKDFTWIICMTGYTFGMVVRSEQPIRNIADLVAFAKSKPGEFTYGSPGVGTSPHLAVEEFAAKAGVKMQHVPFKGVADGLQALIGGHTMGHSDSTGWAPQVDAGRLRLLATYGSKRTRRWAEIPTLNELGFETVSDSPFGVCGPRGMDPAITRIVHDAFKRVLDDAQVQTTLARYDQPVIYMDTAQYTKFAMDTFTAEKSTIERLGMAMK
jgi:tripartite-type tricarboxylate transporter receptor subunit TctC